jgi:hypothetical protein
MTMQRLSEDQIMAVIRKVTTGELREMLTCKRWKDGIDIDQPTFAAERLAEEFRAAQADAPGGQPQSLSIEETRQRAEDAIRTFCRSLGAAAVQMSHGEERIYYAGISLKALSVAVAMAVSRPDRKCK